MVEVNLCTRNKIPLFSSVVEKSKQLYPVLSYALFEDGRQVGEISFVYMSNATNTYRNNRVWNKNLVLYVSQDVDILTYDKKGFVYLFKNRIPFRLIDNRFEVDKEYLDIVKKENKKDLTIKK